jgi:hypothetical protein
LALLRRPTEKGCGMQPQITMKHLQQRETPLLGFLQRKRKTELAKKCIKLTFSENLLL